VAALELMRTLGIDVHTTPGGKHKIMQQVT
jgi:hypothetical protein